MFINRYVVNIESEADM